MVHSRLTGGQAQNASAISEIEQETKRYGLPMPAVIVDPSIRSEGLRGKYDMQKKEITLSSPNDAENGRHEALHYISDMKTGNPLAMFACDDGSCRYHHPLPWVAQLVRR